MLLKVFPSSSQPPLPQQASGSDEQGRTYLLLCQLFPSSSFSQHQTNHFSSPSARAPVARPIEALEPVQHGSVPLPERWDATSLLWVTAGRHPSFPSPAVCSPKQQARLWSPCARVRGHPCLISSEVCPSSPAPEAPCEPGQLPHARGWSPHVLLQPDHRRPKTPLTLLLALVAFQRGEQRSAANPT